MDKLFSDLFFPFRATTLSQSEITSPIQQTELTSLKNEAQKTEKISTKVEKRN